MNDPIEERLRATLRQAAQQTTTSHDIGMPPPVPRPGRSRRILVTAALTSLALVGVGALVASRDDDPDTVQAAAGDQTDAPDTSSSGRPSMSALCANAPKLTLPPRLADKQDELESAIGDWCANGGAGGLAGTAFAACGVELGSLRDLFAPLVDELGPQIDQLKAIFEEFEPRFRAITDDPATKAKIEAGLAPLRERLESLADPANRPDLSDPAARQQLFDQLQADLEPLTSDGALRAQIDPLVEELGTRLESLAASPEVQALKDKLHGLLQSAEAKALGEKLAACFPR
jgi:hypothetical protein